MKIPNAKLDTVLVDKLNPAPYNPRTIKPQALADLKLSIATYGLVEPLVARKSDGLLIGGHQRLAAYLELAAEAKEDVKTLRVPVAWVDVTNVQAKALNMALNRITGEWDYAKLGALIAQVQAEDAAALLGFAEDEVLDYLALADEPTPLPVDETVDVDEGVAQLARKFMFTFSSNEDAEVVQRALAAHGMTGPGNAADALLSMARAVGNAEAAE